MGSGVCTQQVQFPMTQILESLYMMRMRESDQLQKVLAMYEQEINHDRSKPSCQKLKTMVKETYRSKGSELEFFNPKPKDLRPGVLVKTQRGKHVSGGRKSGECFQREKASVQKVMRAAFATTTVSVERKTQSSSLAPRSQTQK